MGGAEAQTSSPVRDLHSDSWITPETKVTIMSLGTADHDRWP
jgi:hypothetical protein